MKVTDRHRVRGKIRSVRGPHREDHGILTTSVYIDCGYVQGFGGLALDEGLADDYVHDLCATFGVRGMDELVGKECYALYSFGEYNELIEGLESADTGKRFLHNAWRKKLAPDTRSILDQKRENLENDIAWAERRAAESRQRLQELSASFVDWEIGVPR